MDGMGQQAGMGVQRPQQGMGAMPLKPQHRLRKWLILAAVVIIIIICVSLYYVLTASIVATSHAT